MTYTTEESLQHWYENDLLPRVDWEGWLGSLGLNPKNRGNYFQIDCPKCIPKGKGEGFFYPNEATSKPQFACNRKKECGYSAHVLEHLNGNKFPGGDQWIAAVKQLADYAGIQVPEKSTPSSPPQKRLLEEYAKWLATRFPGSEGEKYIRSRGLDPSQHEFVLFPSTSQEVLSWAKKNGWTQGDITEAKLILPGTHGAYAHNYKRVGAAIRDSKGRVVNIWGRALSPEATPKYSNLHNSKYANKDHPYIVGPRSKRVVVVEGYLDAVALAECGQRAASAGTSGISDPIWQSLKTRHDEVVICLDQDIAGSKGMLKFLEKHLNETETSIWFINPEKMQGCKDFAELYQKYGKKAVAEAVNPNTWIHRDEMLARLLVHVNVETSGAPTAYESEAVSLKAFELDRRIDNQRCPSFEKFFWRTLCELVGFDLDTIQANIESARERQQREQITNRLGGLSSASSEALLKGDLDTAKQLQQSINHEWEKLTRRTDVVQAAMQPITKESVKEELLQLGEGIRTGLNINGHEILLTRGGITAVGAATSHGKTTFMVNLALNVLKHGKTSVLFITLEEPSSAICTRFINTFAGQELSKNNIGTIKHWMRTGTEEMFSGKKAPEGFLHSEQAFWTLVEGRQLDIKRGGKSLEETISLIKAAVEHNPAIGCVVIDYLQLLYPDTPLSARHEEIKRICDALLETSMDLGVAIVSGAQFNREVKSANDVASTSLGEGGSIERYCDQVIGIWNCSFDSPSEARLSINILKDRNGIRRKGELSWDGNTGKIEKAKSVSDSKEQYHSRDSQGV